MSRILIVEDDFAISELVMMNLSIAGYECDAAYNGAEALKAIEQHEYDLSLLDVMLPEKDGFELMSCMQIHAIPVIYVSAKAEVTDRIKGLRLGAEDYITKPFDIVELQLRVEKVLARVHHHTKAYTVASVLIDEEKRTVSINNQYIDLTPKEFMLMMTLVKHPGVAFRASNSCATFGVIRSSVKPAQWMCILLRCARSYIGRMSSRQSKAMVIA